MSRQYVRLALAAGLMIAATGLPARASVDASGRWPLHVYVDFVPTTVIEHWTQSGTALTTDSGFGESVRYEG
jgi:hypothetical protein